MKKFITYTQSLEILNTISLKKLPTQKLYVADTLQRVLAQDIIAPENSPAFATSSMDGYAIKYEDQQLSKIKILGDNPAGKVIDQEVEKSTTIKTFTGSLMPKGSDTLIPIENVLIENGYIIINTPVPQGFAVREVGENFSKGEILIPKGTILDFAHIGVMASVNTVQVEVFIQPSIAIASTGSEILDVGETQTNDAQIRSSNHLTLEAIAKKYGASVTQMGIVKDDKKTITTLLETALQNAQIVVTTGGVSVGDYDFVKDVIKEELGCEVLFQGVNIKPGQHILFAKKDNKFIIGLPGFAYSSTVTFLLYVLPLLFKLKGSHEHLQIVDAIVDEPCSKKGEKTSFTTCNVTIENGEYHINFQGKKSASSAILTNMLNNPALLVQAQDDTHLKVGEKAKIILL